MATNPFQPGFLATPAQSVAGQLGWQWSPTARPRWNCKATGTRAVFRRSAADKNLYSRARLVPVPVRAWRAGDPKAVLGGGDGNSCTTGATEPACAEFLQFLTAPRCRS